MSRSLQPKATGHAVYHNLPLQPTPLIGREWVTFAACDLLRRRDVRLVTLTGAPGIGKTRLGIQVAADLLQEFPGGVYFVPLAPVVDPQFVLRTVVRGLGIKEAPTQPIIDSLKLFIADQRILLLLDNFEQVVSAAPSLAELLSVCPRLKLLVTSRAILHLRAEHEFSVPPLSLPGKEQEADKAVDDAHALLQHEAIALFVQRAQAVKHSFRLTADNTSAVVEICRQLDGLPLAIELAAARIKILSPQAILSRLEHRLEFLIGGAQDLPERQRTLHRAIGWSYDLLEPEEQALFRRLSVFSGGCTLQAAQAVALAAGDAAEFQRLDPLEGLTALIDKSLLRQSETAEGEARFWMLETIREYASERLENSQEGRQVRRAHALYFCELVERAEPELYGVQQALWFRRLEADYENIRRALGWSLTDEGDVLVGLRLARGLKYFWENYGFISEGRQWLATLLSTVESALSEQVDNTDVMRIQAHALLQLAALAREQAGLTEARHYLLHSLILSRKLGDKLEIARTNYLLGRVALNQGQPVDARRFLEESLELSREVGDRQGLAMGLVGLAYTYVDEKPNDYARASALMKESLAISHELGDSAIIANILQDLGGVELLEGKYADAVPHIEESLVRAQEIGSTRILADGLSMKGEVAFNMKDYPNAEAYLLEGLVLYRAMGSLHYIAGNLGLLTGLASAQGNLERTAVLLGALDKLLNPTGISLMQPISARLAYESTLAAARPRLEEEPLLALWEAGQQMSLEETISYVLGELEVSGPPATASAAPQLSSMAATALAANMAAAAATSPTSHNTYPSQLTPRESDVLRLIAAGKSNEEIASTFVLSVRTVERHINSIYQKIGATGKAARAKATAYALREGLVR